MPASGTGGVPPLNVSIRITTSGARAAASAMGSVTRASGGMSRGMTAGVISARTLGDAMRMSASLMKYTVAGAFMKVGTAAVQAARNFELSFSRIRGLTGMAADSVESMKAGVLEMATATTRGPEELAEALYFVTSSGLRDTDVAMDVLNASAKASAAGLGETKTVVDAVTSAMNAYGPANLSAARATDVLVATVREGKAEADTFAPAFSKVLPVAAAFGASSEDVAAAMAALTRSGMTAGTAGIYVRQVLSQLLKPSKQASDMLAQVGTSAEQVRDNIREKGMFVALQELSTRLGGIDEGAPAFAKVFGNVRALTAMLQLVGPAAAENELVFERLQNSTGDLSVAFEAYEETIDAQFNKALAASRVALIEIGDAIKPVVTTILKIATGFAKVAKVVLDNPLGKGILTVVAGFTLLVVSMSAAMQTTSALIRLFANMTITLTGNQIMYNATTKSLYRYSGAATTAAASTHTLTVAGRTYTKMSITMAGGIKKVALALKALVAANKVMLAIVLTIAAGMAIFKFFEKASKKAKEVSEGVSKITDIMDEAVKFAKTTFAVDVSTNLDDTETANAVERIGEQIEEMSPGFVKKVKGVFENAGEESGIQYLNALMNSVFGGMTEDTKEKLLAYFMEEFNIKEEQWAEVLGFENISGDAATDAFLQSAVLAAAGAEEVFADAMTAKGGAGFINMFDQIAEETQASFDKLEPSSSKTRAAMKEYGNAIIDGVTQTEGSLQPLLLTIKQLDETGSLTANNLDNIFGNALHQLAGDLNIAKEENADFYEIFKHGDNKDALTKMIQQTTGLGTAAAAVKYQNIKNEIIAMSKTTPYLEQSAAAARILVKELGGSLEISEDIVTVNADAAESYSLLRDEIKNSIEAYAEQKNVMKQLEDVQRSLLGINLTQEESLRDVYDAFSDLRDGVADGGGFNIVTEAGRKNRKELQSAAEAVAEYANTVYAETGDAAMAGLKFQEGIMGIIANSGAKGTEAQQLLVDMGFTPDWYAKSLIAGEEEVTQQSTNIGKNVMDGVSMGINANAANLSQTLITALRGVLITAEGALGISSPSKVTAESLGIPMAQGVGAGFKKELKNQSGGMAKDLNTAVSKMYTGKYDQKSVQKFFKNFLEKKKQVETPAQDFVKATIGRMKEIIGSLGNYIKSQLSFRDAQANLAKLINMQRKYDDDRKKSARAVQYAETRRGRSGGAEVTGYEQAELDQLQIEFERVSRDYAMGRASYIELVDAEIALFEARAAATEINDEVISSQNDFIDKSVAVENKNLELAAATVDVLAAYQDVQEASYELYINHKELEGVYQSLAVATGIASGKIVVGSKDLSTLGEDVGKLGGYTSTVGGYVSTLGNNVSVTGQSFTTQFYGPNGIFGTITKTGVNVKTLTDSIGASFTDMSRGLLDPNSEMYKNLKSLGPAIFNAIQTAANERFATSPLHLHIPVNVTTSVTGGGGSATVTDPYKALTYDQFAQNNRAGIQASLLNAYRASLQGGQYQGVNVSAAVAAYGSTPGYFAAVDKALQAAYARYLATRAVGGPVSAMNPYLVGERGPEMFVPNTSGTIVTNSALERYTRTRTTGADKNGASPSNNIVVTVNNPVPAAAEDSITRRMKVLANSGLFG